MVSSMMRLRGGIGQRAFQAVAHLDAQRAIVLGDQQQRAVVGLRAPELPGLGHADRVLLDGLGRRAWARSAPRPARPCAPRRPRASARARPARRAVSVPVRSVTRASSVGTAAAPAPRAALAARRHTPAARSQAAVRQRATCRAAPARYRAGGAPASRRFRRCRGAEIDGRRLAIAASFSTAKFGLSAYLNIIAVRLLGNERTVML